MNKVKFSSQVCTSVKQSKRLLDLGLKPETADMAWICVTKEGLTQWVMTLNTPKNKPNIDIPAWSLHRLIELYKDVEDTSMWSLENVNYNRLILCISLAIKHGAFNKEYLKQ